jgi:hypothetical protein
MKWFTVARFVRILTLKAALFGATAAFTLLAPLAHSQQDVAPTWFDPWAPSNKVVVKPSQPRTSDRNQRRGPLLPRPTGSGQSCAQSDPSAAGVETHASLWGWNM